MKARKISVALVLVLLSAFAIAPMGVAAAPKQPTALTEQITNAPVTDLAGTVLGTLTGSISIDRFVARNGQLFAVADITGQVTNALGQVIGEIDLTDVLVPITATGTCDILTLDLGPLHVDLLGLVIDLSAIHLDIVAQAGAGNLLGNLLCAVAHLLDNGGPLQGLVNLLNNILRQL